MTERADKIFTFFLVSITFIFITVTAFIYTEDVFIIVPLYISLTVMFLQSRANRYAFLLGGINSLLYAAVDIYIGLYASAASAALVSCPLQLITFFSWSKRPYGTATIFKKLGLKNMLVLAAVSVASWLAMWAFFSMFHSEYLLFDNTLTLIGIVATILCAMAYIEYTYLQMLSLGIGIVLYGIMLKERPIQITYLIYNVYALICSAKAFLFMNRLYAEQKVEKGVTV